MTRYYLNMEDDLAEVRREVNRRKLDTMVRTLWTIAIFVMVVLMLGGLLDMVGAID